MSSAGGRPKPARWVLLHGFAGSPASWDDTLAELRAELPPIVPWLCGHGPGAVGPSGASCAAGFAGEVERLAARVDAVPRAPRERRVVAGYSLGGRLALGLVLEHPELFDAAVLVSAHPGLDDETVRAERRAADERWAALLEREGIGAFVDAWEAQPVFAGQDRLSASVLDRQRRTRLAHDARALAGAMRTLSLGGMPCYGSRLAAAALPVWWVAGERDLKFGALAEAAAERMAAARVETLAACGHNPLLEAPAELARLLRGVALEVAAPGFSAASPGAIAG
jgi:2-succinyl-6-hydroxy-2,4-cyclohexadiene-1-carboxylate synthase